MNKKQFGIYSQYYDLIYKDKDYSGEIEYVYEKLTNYIHNLNTILEIGTGTGIHAGLLAEKGLTVTGIEISQEMALQAIQKGIECHVHDCSEFNLKRKYDAAISLFHVISYISENEKLVKTFKNVHQHLNPGGVFLFDVWYSPAVYFLKPETRIKRIENKDLKITRIAEPTIDYNKNVIDVNYEIIIEEIENNKITKIHETHTMRHFSLPELNLLAMNTRFQILEAEEWMTRDKPSEKTWGICLILRKE
jgi:SAM-dependent methyltransferase